MKRNLIFSGLLIVMLALGFFACDSDGGSSNPGGGSQKGLTINGIGLSGNVTIVVCFGNTMDTTVAAGTLSGVSNGSNVTFSLNQVNIYGTTVESVFLNASWNGNGTYMIGVYNMTPAQILQAGQQLPMVYFPNITINNATATVSWADHIVL